MDLSFDDIKPFLSERGALEVELAAMRATVAKQGEIIQQLASAIPSGEEPTDG